MNTDAIPVEEIDRILRNCDNYWLEIHNFAVNLNSLDNFDILVGHVITSLAPPASPDSPICSITLMCDNVRRLYEIEFTKDQKCNFEITFEYAKVKRINGQLFITDGNYRIYILHYQAGDIIPVTATNLTCIHEVL